MVLSKNVQMRSNFLNVWYMHGYAYVFTLCIYLIRTAPSFHDPLVMVPSAHDFLDASRLLLRAHAIVLSSSILLLKFIW